YSLILPSLKEVFHYEIEEGIEENIEREPLKVELYFNYDGQAMLVEQSFKYSENAINPLLSKSEEKTEVTSDTGTSSIFIRDVYNENDTMNVLSHFFKQAEVKEGKYVLDQFEDISTLI